jgi:hypothetical protein
MSRRPVQNSRRARSCAVILMTDDKAKMGPLIIFNRHILILRCDNLSLLAGKRAIR